MVQLIGLEKFHTAPLRVMAAWNSCRLELVPEESPDWDYARNKRVVLMAPSAEWVQSVYSVTWELDGARFIAPNRDYPYEGLLAHHAGENWKFIDCIALALRDRDGRHLPVQPNPAVGGVRATPWRTAYAYVAAAPGNGGEIPVPFFAVYYLGSNSSPELATAELDVYFPRPAREMGLTLIVQPFLDIRHMYAGSNFGDYRLHHDEQQRRLHVVYMDRRVTFHLPQRPAGVVLFDSPQRIAWDYKLGTGSRQEVAGGDGRMETRFVEERREVASFFRLEIPLASRRLWARLPFSCGLEASSPHASYEEARAHLRQSRRADREELRRIQSTFRLRDDLPFKDALVGRIVGLKKFKTFVHVPDNGEHVKLPHAGAWWFRTPWYRDVFEGISNSFETLMRLPDERENVRQTVLKALRHQHPKSGLIQARLPEFASHEPSYNSSDATLLCLLVASRYAARTGDRDFAREVLPRALWAIAAFRDNHERDRSGNGPPRLHPETGLLLSVPHHSWIDTQSQYVDYAGWRMEQLPNRVSKRFVKDLYDAFGDKGRVESVLFTASFFLPEVNAQWLRVLGGVLDMVRRAGVEAEEGSSPVSPAEVAGLLERARRHFKPVFWNPDKQFLFNVVEEQRQLRDEIECEAAVTAAAMLERTVFTEEELRAIWRRTQRVLLVQRTLQRYGSGTAPFGILTKNEDKRIFYDDDQYHSDVVWPRSTAYLVRLLDILGEKETARELLVNMLDHQMAEAAIFYNQEVLSRACGNNPRPAEATRMNPVPVKNPIQFWSQWCDAFLDAFEERTNRDA
jgi:glycogen debranching enzyme